MFGPIYRIRHQDLHWMVYKDGKFIGSADTIEEAHQIIREDEEESR